MGTLRHRAAREAAWIFFCAAAALASAGRAAPPVPTSLPSRTALPKPTRYVTDNAAVLPADRAAALNEKLARFERETSDQILIYTEKKIPEGTTLEELGARSIREWGPGQKGKSNGLIFFVFPDDRKMRIEVGYGLEGAIPDARSHRITDEIVKPFFRQGDFAGGIEAGVDALLSAARGEPYTGTGKTVAEAAEGSGHPSVPVTTIPFAVLPIGCLGLLILLTFAVIAARKENARAARKRFMTGVGPASPSSFSFFSPGSSSSSSSDSSSDFSGGGGDGGGGGSSDSW